MLDNGRLIISRLLTSTFRCLRIQGGCVHTYKRLAFFKRAFHSNAITSLHLSHVGDEYPPSLKVYIVTQIPCYFVQFYGRLVLMLINRVWSTTWIEVLLSQVTHYFWVTHHRVDGAKTNPKTKTLKSSTITTYWI